MKITYFGNNKLTFDGNDYKVSNLIINLYKNLLKSTKELIELSVNHPNNILYNIVLRLKNGEKLEISCYYDFKKLNLFDINCYIKSENRKYLLMFEDDVMDYSRSDNEYYQTDVIITESGYNFKVVTKTWYNESKLLNKENFREVVIDYISELNHELERFESMVSYGEIPTYENGKDYDGDDDYESYNKGEDLNNDLNETTSIIDVGDEDDE